MAKGRKTGGRRKGTPNRRTSEQKAEIHDLARDAFLQEARGWHSETALCDPRRQ